MTGRVTKYFKRKNYGFIQSDNSSYYFNMTDCEDYEGYNIGDLVKFEVLGERAVHVKKCIR